MLYCNAMKFAAVAALVLFVAATAGAQDRRQPGPRHPSSQAVPPSRIVPPVLSTRLPTVLPPAPEPPRAAERVPDPPKMTALHGPDTFYVIPGCYMGNQPPNPARLPKGCDPAKLRTTSIR